MEGTQVKRRFDKVFKISAIKMVEEGRRPSEVAWDLGIHENLIFRWKKKYAKYGEKVFVGKGNLTEIAKLRRKNENNKIDNEILKKCDEYIFWNIIKRYEFVKDNESYGIERVCRLAKVSKSGYYAWKHRNQISVRRIYCAAHIVIACKTNVRKFVTQTYVRSKG